MAKFFNEVNRAIKKALEPHRGIERHCRGCGLGLRFEDYCSAAGLCVACDGKGGRP